MVAVFVALRPADKGERCEG